MSSTPSIRRQKLAEEKAERLLRRQALDNDRRCREVQATADKTARLRALRLARDARDSAPGPNGHGSDPELS